MIRPKANSFTLVEMIGAMAILAILASVLAPSVVRQVQTATSVGEDANLADIAQALTNAIRTTGLIPNPNLEPSATNATGGFGWAYLASNYTRLAGSNLVSVFPGMTNETGRRLYLSTNLVALASQGGFANTVSNWGATLFPTNAKMYLVSASRPEFNLLLATNGAGAQTTNNSYASAAVNSLDSWVKQFSNGVTVAPANIVDPSWTNRGEFLHVRTIDLAPIFSEVKAAQQKAIEQEDKNLEEIARALVAAIQATGQLPNPNVKAFDAGGWANLAQNYTTLTANTPNPPANANERGSLEFAFPRDANGGLTARRVFLDPRLMRYLVANGSFLTPNNGWNSTTDADASGTADMNEGAMRMYILSSSKPDLVLAATAPVNGPNVQTAATYDNNGLLTALLNWKKVYTPPSDPMPGVIPVPDVIARWGNPYTPLVNYFTRGEFVNVKVVDLRPLFCRVELIDTACPPTAVINLGGDAYQSPDVTFFSGAAVFDVRDTSSVPITTIRSLIATDRCVLRNPAPQYVGRTASLSAVNINGDQTSSAPSPSTATPALNPQPRFQIPISGSVSTPVAPPGGMFPANVQAFYVLKGTSLQLWDNASGTPVLTTTIESDSSFKYFGSTWTRVD